MPDEKPTNDAIQELKAKAAYLDAAYREMCEKLQQCCTRNRLPHTDGDVCDQVIAAVDAASPDESTEALRDRLETCSSGEIVAAANRVRDGDARGLSAEQIARNVVVAALFVDGWLNDIKTGVRQ